MNRADIISIAHAAGIDGSDESILLFAKHILAKVRNDCVNVVEDEAYDYVDKITRQALADASHRILTEVAL